MSIGVREQWERKNLGTENKADKTEVMGLVVFLNMRRSTGVGK